MATTTPGAIRDVLIALVAAATPDRYAERFRAHVEDATHADDFAAWAEANAAACLRRFSIMFRHDVTIPDVCDGVTGERVRQTFDFQIAWPVANRYYDLKGLADTIAMDMRKVRGTIGYAGFPLTYAAHGSLCTVLSESPDLVQRGKAVTIGSLELTVEYWRVLL